MLGLSGPISSENALTLADILRRTVVIEWFEGVALVRAIIDRLNSVILVLGARAAPGRASPRRDESMSMAVRRPMNRSAGSGSCCRRLSTLRSTGAAAADDLAGDGADTGVRVGSRVR